MRLLPASSGVLFWLGLLGTAAGCNRTATGLGADTSETAPTDYEVLGPSATLLATNEPAAPNVTAMVVPGIPTASPTAAPTPTVPVTVVVPTASASEEPADAGSSAGGATASGGDAATAFAGGAGDSTAGGASGAGGTAAVAAGGASGGATGAAGQAGAGGAPTTEPLPEFELLGTPLLFDPTESGFSANAVVVTGDPTLVHASTRVAGSLDWTEPSTTEYPAEDVAQWRFDGLEPGTLYEYQVTGQGEDGEVPLYAGTITTERTPDDSHFVFALITDTHISPRSVLPGELDTEDSEELTLLDIAPKVRAQNPDFIMNLGDTLDFHLFGFNDPPPDGTWTRLGYLNYRRLMQDALGNAAYFSVIGNWDGENGSYSDEELARSRDQRLLYVPGPSASTYPEGGSEEQDYYAFTWGDALFIVLNVMSYTPTEHLLSTEPGVADDWTLGDAQLAWFMDTLQNATSKWRFVMIHHTVGGAAGDDINSAYGRGGGQAAYVGEQAVVHQLMLDYGVQIFFYGHDHVFTDMAVDGIHYTLPGSAGAPWKFTTAETGYTDYWPDSGYARVEVSKANVQVAFISQDDELLYGYTITQ